MYQVRFHGRGGQGVVTAAELLSIAAFEEGKHAQAFPSFGSERMGAPVMAYCRISNQEIRLREPIFTPDALIVQDATLLRLPDVLSGLESTRVVIVNARMSAEELPAEQLKRAVGVDRLVVLPATQIALDCVGRNVPNVIMLAAFAAASGLFTMAMLEKACAHKFKGAVLAGNIKAAERAYQLVSESGKSAKEMAHV